MLNWAGRKKKLWEADSKKACLVLVGGFFFLLFSAFLGEMHRRRCPAAAFAVEEYDRADNINKDAEVFLAQEQLEALRQLEIFMAGASIHQAARRLGQEKLQPLWEAAGKITGEEAFYICDGKLVSRLEGMGLALRKDKVCFYGNFQNGKPEGVCSAIACFEDEGLGYAYSMGLWKDGEMEGLGITGRYLQRAGEQKPRFQEQIAGVFQKDRLEGQLTYEQVKDGNTSCWWKITASGGKTCLDARWSFLPGLLEYRLLSEKEKQACFVLPQNLLEQVRWKNLVPWK